MTATVPEKKTSARAKAAKAGKTGKTVKSVNNVQPTQTVNALKKSAAVMLDAGRGNPNWVATAPREAFLALGSFALEESRRVWTMDNLGGRPAIDGAALRFDRFCTANPGLPGVRLLRDCVDYGITKLGFEPDAWIHELTDSWIGDNYPLPERILHHCQEVVRAYLAREMYGGKTPGPVDCFATEGGTAAMCYLFDTLVTNGILEKGDTIALMTPISTPYLEIPELERYSFDVVHVQAELMTEDGVHTWRHPDDQVDKLADPKVKALILVNPSNPPSTAMSDRVRDRIADIIETENPNLAVITDDVYGTFVPGFRSLAASCPRNTALVYSWSKHYGATGHRLGVIAVARDNVFDELIARLPKAKRDALADRYRSLSQHPEKISFVDRLAADSRQVALNHTAGLSLPQQVMMTLFSLFDLLPEGQEYKELLRTIVHRRLTLLMEGVHRHISEDPGRAAYYVELDILAEAEHLAAPEFATYLRENYEPPDVVFRLARRSGAVLLNGGGFDGPDWSVRVCLADLDDLDYLKIGHHLHAILEEHRDEWQSARS